MRSNGESHIDQIKNGMGHDNRKNNSNNNIKNNGNIENNSRNR
jgi:hypothetical protein